MQICGRPLTFGDEQQRQIVRRMEREDELKRDIIENINRAIDAMNIYTLDGGDDWARRVAKEAATSLLGLAGVFHFDFNIEDTLELIEKGDGWEVSA